MYLVDVDDTLPSIFSSDMAIGNYVAQRAGIGINAGRIRGINAELEEVKSNTQELYLSSKSLRQRLSVVLKTVFVEGRNCSLPYLAQRNRRHYCFKNNKGTEDNRVRKLDYSIQII